MERIVTSISSSFRPNTRAPGMSKDALRAVSGIPNR